MKPLSREEFLETMGRVVEAMDSGDAPGALKFLEALMRLRLCPKELVISRSYAARMLGSTYAAIVIRPAARALPVLHLFNLAEAVMGGMFSCINIAYELGKTDALEEKDTAPRSSGPDGANS